MGKSTQNGKITPAQMLDALEQEKALLEDFICLSEEQVILLKDENLDGFDALLHKRAHLMMDLSIIEVKLAQWIQSIYLDPTVAPATIEQMQRMNDEIVRMANHVIQIDEHAQQEFDHIKQRTRAEIVVFNKKRFAKRDVDYPVRQNGLNLED
jgi:hypothetical protein